MNTANSPHNLVNKRQQTAVVNSEDQKISDISDAGLPIQNEMKLFSFEKAVQENSTVVIVNDSMGISSPIEAWNARLTLSECRQLHQAISDKCGERLIRAISKAVPYDLRDDEAANKSACKFLGKSFISLRSLYKYGETEELMKKDISRFRKHSEYYEAANIIGKISTNVFLNTISYFDTTQHWDDVRLTSVSRSERPVSSIWAEGVSKWFDDNAEKFQPGPSYEMRAQRDYSWVQIIGKDYSAERASRLYINLSENVSGAEAIEAMISIYTDMETIASADFKAVYKPGHFDKLVCYLTPQQTKNVGEIAGKLVDKFGVNNFEGDLIGGREIARGIRLAPTEEYFRHVMGSANFSFHQAILGFTIHSHAAASQVLGTIDSKESRDYAGKVFTDLMCLALLARP